HALEFGDPFLRRLERRGDEFAFGEALETFAAISDQYAAGAVAVDERAQEMRTFLALVPGFADFLNCLEQIFVFGEERGEFVQRLLRGLAVVNLAGEL